MTDRPLALEIVGYGRMGRAVERAAVARGHEVVAITTRAGSRDPGGGEPRRPDLAIDFTLAEAAPRLIRERLERGIPVVSGTTGCEDRLGELRELADRLGVGFLWAANFALGVQVLFRAAELAARWLGGDEAYAPFVYEEHHAGKRDAPSGTAKRLGSILLERTPRLRRFGPAPAEGGLPSDLLPVAWIRAGTIAGTHVVGWDAGEERLELRHVCRSRDTFARGAVAAAEWLATQRGARTIEEMLEARAPLRGGGGS